MTLFAVLRPGPFLATVKSPAALVRIGLLLLVLIALSRLRRRFVPNPTLARPGGGSRRYSPGGARVQAAVPALVAVGALALVVLPYFQDETVVETLPGSAADLGLAVPVLEPAALGVTASAPDTTTTTVPAAPVRVTAGTVRGIDHRATGGASVYRLADGTAFVRLEDIDVQNGPDYFVFLVPGTDRRTPGTGVDLGPLKGNQGTQNYAVPAGIDVSAPHTVLIWCRAFAVPVANASQAPVS